ncbi:MAG: glycosyltransferase family 2 protein, partial [Candidatus Eisenbacteria bacterium]|nr:glycosyltransferase family 2 protein [Candidatus Eisenbacteria bacterium]
MTVSLVSVVIPVYNEAESLLELHSRLDEELKRLGVERELIFIDDGSLDSTQTVLSELSKKDPTVKAFVFRRNLGKSAALSVGFGEAAGDVVVTLDGDLQDDPAEIGKLIRKLDEGYDLVSGWKKKRMDPIGKKIPSKLFNFVTSKLTGINIHDFNCGLKAYRCATSKESCAYKFGTSIRSRPSE